MEPKAEEKAIRLQLMLQEALKPIIEKLTELEQEMKGIQQKQEEIRELLLEKSVK